MGNRYLHLKRFQELSNTKRHNNLWWVNSLRTSVLEQSFAHSSSGFKTWSCLPELSKSNVSAGIQGSIWLSILAMKTKKCEICWLTTFPRRLYTGKNFISDATVTLFDKANHKFQGQFQYNETENISQPYPKIANKCWKSHKYIESDTSYLVAMPQAQITSGICIKTSTRKE